MKPLSAHLEEFLSYSTSLNRSRHTVRMLRHGVGHTLHWLEAEHSVTLPTQLDVERIEAWTRHVAQRCAKSNGLPLKPATVGKQFESDRAFLKWLEKRGVLPMGFHDAIPRIKLPALLPTSVLSHSDIVRLLGRIDVTNPAGIQLRAMLELLYSSGIRPDELLGLDTTSIDLPNQAARVLGKGQKERVVPFGRTARRFLESYLRCVRPLLASDIASPAVWLDRNGCRMPYYTFRRKLVALVRQLQLPKHVTSYTFRRSCATELVRGGANLWHVKDLLGHENLETLKHYAKLTAVDLKKTHARYHPRDRNSA